MIENGQRFLSASKLKALAEEIETRWPAAVLVPNEVGNLAIVHGGSYEGYIDFAGDGEVCIL